MGSAVVVTVLPSSANAAIDDPITIEVNATANIYGAGHAIPPVGNFIQAIAVHQMLRKLVDQVIPFGPIFRGRNILLVPESMGRIFEASFLGMKLSSTKGRTPFCSRPSYAWST